MPDTMKKLTLLLLIFSTTLLHAQAMDPEDIFARDVNAMDSIPQLIELAREMEAKDQFARQEVVIQRLLVLRPFNPDFKFALVKAFAQQDKKTDAYNTLIEIQKAGLSYPIGELEGYENIQGTNVYDYIEENMVKNAEPFGEGQQVFAVSHHYSGMLFENIAYDATADRLLLGSVRAGAVYQHDAAGGFKEFIKPADPQTGPWGIVDLVVDQQADLLWTASATLPHYNGTTPNNFGHAMISKFKLSTGELINNFAMQRTNQPLLFTALHVSEGQNLYFINAFNSQLFKIAKGSEQVERVLALPNLTAIKAITTNSDESVIYVSDYDQGLYLINTQTQQLAPLVPAGAGFFAGINDLFYDDGDLVAIQSGVKPARLMRYVLEQDVILQNMFPIEASNPAFQTLGNGVLVGDQVYYTANTQWEKVDALGRLLPEQQWEPLLVMQSPTKYRMEEHMERMRRIEEIKKKRGIQ
ncbi:hypothetical protein [Marinicella meishanensis]|uniref:hypothetical protein n=1 Tax=Marinicella meishanensis TaxID=2873263 RepID=UPI001CBD5D67|nr:hypothetical protein [Marinicella sp. NBU2979]